MISIGLTGGIGSGKSTAAGLFHDLGVTIIDADEIAHRITQPGQVTLEAIFMQFGEDLKLEDGSLDRNALRRLVFNNPGKRQQLESITHPLIRDAMQQQRRQLTEPYCIMVIPLLLEKQQQDLVDRVLVIDCTIDKQRQRVLKRPGLDEKQFLNILDAQVSREMRLAAADDILHNENNDITLLKQQITDLHERYNLISNGT